MSESTKMLDARGLACPEPVLRVKRVLEEGGCARLEVLVDNAAARENVSRFVLYSGNDLLSVREEGGVFTLVVGLRQGAGAEAAAEAANAACVENETTPNPAGQLPLAATFFLRSDRIGTGDDDLGALLMRAFLATLGETEPAPARLILMNGGVRLAVEGSDCLESLHRLERAGIEILACGTCLKHFKLEDRLAVGRVSNMYEIAGALLRSRVVTI